jgi:hypothetical protein
MQGVPGCGPDGSTLSSRLTSVVLVVTRAEQACSGGLRCSVRHDLYYRLLADVEKRLGSILASIPSTFITNSVCICIFTRKPFRLLWTVGKVFLLPCNTRSTKHHTYFDTESLFRHLSRLARLRIVEPERRAELSSCIVIPVVALRRAVRLVPYN